MCLSWNNNKDPFLAFRHLLLCLSRAYATHSSVAFINSHREVENNRLSCLAHLKSRPLEYTHTHAHTNTLLDYTRQAKGDVSQNRRDYWDKTFNSHLDSSSEARGTEYWCIGILFSNLSVGPSRVNAVIFTSCYLKWLNTNASAVLTWPVAEWSLRAAQTPRTETSNHTKTGPWR